ncbi:MAG: MATE family efflux transporter [Clostridia bacterium]
MQKNLTDGNVFRVLLVFSVPFFISYFLQTVYGLADLFIIGQFNGADVITAVSVGSQVMHMITVFIVGLSMGSTVMISRAVGARAPEKTARAIGNTVTLFMAVSVVFTVVLLLLVNPIVSLMSTPPESVEQTRTYLRICFSGIPFITAYNVLGSVFRGLGDSKSPMYFIAAACGINILLDFVFIGLLGMTAAGAALATVIAQTVSVIIAFVMIRKRGLGLSLGKDDFRPDGRTAGSILKIGAPVSLQDGFIQISFLIITVIANQRGVEVAAAVGIVEKIISVLFLVPSSMLSSISAIVAQNLGAGLHLRGRQTLYYGIGLCVGYGAVLAVLFQFFQEPAVAMFTDDPSVILFGGQYLKAYAIDCMLAGVHFCFSGFFCAYGMSVISFLHNAVSVILIRVPGSYLAAKLFPATLYPMGLAAPAGSLLSILICSAVYVWFLRKQRNENRFPGEVQ